MPEVFDPKNREPEYYNNRDEDEIRRKRNIPRIQSFFASKPFMLGYGFFLTTIVLIIMAYQRGGISNIPILSNYFGTGIYAKSKIVNEKGDKYITVTIKNIKYKYENIMNFESTITLYKKDVVIAAKTAAYTDMIFPKGSGFQFIVDFPKEEIDKADRFIVISRIDDLEVENKVPLF